MKIKNISAAIILVSILMVGCNSSTSRIDSLLNQFTKDNQGPSAKALNELIEIGKPVMKPAVERLKKEGDPWKQQYYLILLFNISDESISDDILPYTKSNNGDVREWAIFVLGKKGNKNSIEALINSLSDFAVEEQAKIQAVKRLQELTGENIPFKEGMTFQQKKASVKAWKNWWSSKQKNT